ncbi:MAG: sensor histidine kinase [Vicinamibacterales bacterium]
MRRLRLTAPAKPEPVLFVIAALLGASVLVVYLQYRAITSLRREAEMVTKGVSESVATEVVDTIAGVLNGPVRALESVNQPELNAGRLDLVAAAFRSGLVDYPQIDRFFLWNHLTEAVAPSQVLFLARQSSGPVHAFGGSDGGVSFLRDTELGRLLYREMSTQLQSQRNYFAVEDTLGDTRYLSVIRVFWTNPRREQPFTVLGYVIKLDDVRLRLFSQLHESVLASLLSGRYDLKLQIFDEHGLEVFASGAPLPRLAATAAFPLQFYPDAIKLRMSPAAPPPVWRIAVGPAGVAPLSMYSASEAYWLLALSISLIAIALGFAIQGHRRAKELARMQRDFISHVSHQVKTPLSLLMATLETIALERVGSAQRLARYHGVIREQAERLSVLISSILDFSRIESRQQRYEFEPVDLRVLVAETVEAFQRSLADGGYDIRLADEPDRPVVHADASALEQALVNLLDNAVKYSGQNRTIGVTVRAVHNSVQIAVRDDGIGIPPGERHRIFERFYRGSGAAMHRHGFGLGLAICAELVGAHGGRITVSSAVGAGSVFTIHLPQPIQADAGLFRRGELQKASVPRAS